MLEQIELPQDAVRHAQGILHTGSAPRHGNIGEVREPLIGLRVCKQHFPAPDRAVRAEPRSVEGDSAHRARKAVLAYDRSDVRMVMLHLNQWDIELSRLFTCPFRSEVLRVRIAGKARRAQLEELLEAAFRVEPGVERLGVFQIAHMLGDERLRTADESEGAFLLRARRKEHRGDRSSFVACGFGRALMTGGANRLGGRGVLGDCSSLRVGARPRQLQRHGRETASAADHLHGRAHGSRRDDANHRIIVARKDGAIVAQHGARDAAKFPACLDIVGDDWLIVDVSRGHHKHRRFRNAHLLEGAGEIVQQEELHRGGGEHNAQLEQLVGKARGKRHALTLLQQHDRARRIREGLLLLGRHLADAARRLGVRHHDRERLAAAALSLAKPSDCLCIARVAHQMEPTEPLHGHDLPGAQQLDRPRDEGIRGLARFSPGDAPAIGKLIGGHVPRPARREVLARRRLAVGAPSQRKVRAALEARVRLRVEAAVERVGVFGGAALAHGEILHRRARAIVGKRIDDGKARPAIGTVDEGVAEATVVRVEQFRRAVVARGQVGRHKRGLLHCGVVREANLKRVEVLKGHFLKLDFLHLGRCRRILGKLDHELVEQAALPFRMDVHTVRRVQNPSVNQVFLRHSIDKGPKPDPLDDSRHMNIERLDHASHPQKT